jgi:BirA family biotin operon repressor/biotin-[acetyl-CoA-carboxylase] ligase
LSMVALGDCLGALIPPQVGVTFLWPNQICVNGAPAGTFRAAAAAAEEGVPPAWMVIGLSLRHQRKGGDPEPGDTPDVTWLAEEGGAELTRTQIIESYCRHFLTWLNTWDDEGFRPVHDSWLYRAEQRDQEVTLSHAGEEVSGSFAGLDDSGNLLIKGGDGATRALYLADIFERPAAKAAS